MSLLHFYDRATLEASVTLPLDPELHALLTARVAHMRAEGIIDMTELVVIEGATTEADLIDALGWSPLTDPDGRRHNDPGFVQPFDYVYRVSPSYVVAVQLVGNSGFAFELVIHEDADPDLLALCREQAA